jgi:hypothetical protein
MADLRPSVLSLACADQHQALQEVRGLKMWRHRAGLLESVRSNDICNIGGNEIPLDGRTVRPEHLETIWQVFGFPGTPTVSPSNRLALKDVADARNELAHGDEDPRVVAGRKSRVDLLQIVERIDELMVNLWVQAEEYLDQRLYLR